MARTARLSLCLLLTLGLVGAVVVATTPAAPESTRALLLVVRDGGVWRVPADGGGGRLVPGTRRAENAAWAPSGRELAFARAGVVHVQNTDGLGQRPLLRGTDPTWSPDGRRIAVVQDGRIVVARRNGRSPQAVTDGPSDADPAWAPDGRRVAFVRDGVVSIVRPATRVVAAVAEGDDPAWSPDGRRIAYAHPAGIASATPDGTDVRIETLSAGDRSPLWTQDMSELIVVQHDNIIVAHAPDGTRRPLASGTSVDRGFVPMRAELLPDLDQRAPHRIGITTIRGRHKLGFASAVDNVGRGPLWIRGTRNGNAMAARQLVRVVGGAIEQHGDAGMVKYVGSSTHSHWHLLRFESYELRRFSDHALLVRDRKSGFCLADHYGHARRVRPVRPVFLGNCRSGEPGARSVDQGSSVGYTDRYPPNYHGQNVDLTGIPPGTYLLVHRANPERLLRERRYDNNVASVRLRLTRPGGVPHVRVLKSCEGSERC